MTRDLAAQAKQLLALHQPGTPLVLPNVWDAGSAKLVQEAGHPALATASAAVAASLGYPDGEQTPVAEFFAATRRITDRVDLPLTMDCEAGYGLPAPELVRLLTESGAVGLNLEDTDPATGTLRGVDTQVALITAVRSAATALGVDVVINARTDVFLPNPEPSAEILAEGVNRAKAYRDAGADCLYPLLLTDEQSIGEFVTAVEAPVNILRYPPSPTIARLGELGVARISFGPGLHNAAQEATRTMLTQLA